MHQSDSTFFRMLRVIASFFTLQVLWFFFSLGMITIIPATLAMYAVVLDWSKHGIDIEIWKTFYHSFTYHLRNTTYFGVTLLAFCIIFAWKASVLSIAPAVMDTYLRWIWLFVGGIFLLTFMSIVPFLVISHLKGIRLWKNAWVVSISTLPQALFLVGLTILLIVSAVYQPLAFLMCMGLFAFIHIQVWQRAVKQKLPDDFLDQCLFKHQYR
ncbi:hypothetical protein J416_00244 [Gracilibacillus halophilus YIM-C55.5]|uniref:DUF624 domain-containing protein n=1 Tax=Gracilibacillus halophilus YIM-C55.5 TaxID=1308866 RepID=N4WVF1_9BACI|nr:YesL family protein [Gracilibacillus halophilus]ENH98370.1 hypothetical protein J416_00244 [Gracilibacillus halophilus YIM-C55.5]